MGSLPATDGHLLIPVSFRTAIFRVNIVSLSRWFLVSSTALLLTVAGAVRAQETQQNDVRLDALLQLLNTPVTVASRRAEGLFTTPSTVTVLDRATMDLFDVQTVEEALALAAGVQLWGSPSKRRSLPTIRGILQDNYASKVLILIDGIPTFHGSLGDGYFFRMDASALERIEVLRGPASVMYGSNAYVGAINLVLRKKALTRDGETSVGLGNRGGYQGGAWFAMNAPFDLLVSGSHGRQQGRAFIFKGADGVSGPYHDFDQSSSVTAKVGYAGHRLLVNAFRETKAYLGADSSFASGAGQDDRYQGVLVNYTFEHEVMEGWKLRVGATHDRAARLFSRTLGDTERSNVDGYRDALSLRSSWELGKGWGFELGGDYDKRKSVEYSRYYTAGAAWISDYNMKNLGNTERSALAQLNYNSPGFGLVFGTRYTNNELAGSNTASRLTLVFPLNPRNSVKFIAGQSFRAPTLFEQFFSRFGNPAVQPEKADTYEMTYLTAIDKVFLQGTLYHSTYKGKIFRARTNPTNPADLTVSYINGGAFRATGFEMEMKFKNPGIFNAFLSTDVLLKTDRGDEVLLPTPTDHYNFKYTPRFTGKAGISRQWGAWFISADASWMSGAKGTGLQPPSIGSQGAGNLHGGFTHGWGRVTVKHTLSVRNLGDKVLEFANYVNLDQPALPVIPMDARGTQTSYTLRMAF
jgi:outer membrane cobalamin receptor